MSSAGVSCSVSAGGPPSDSRWPVRRVPPRWNGSAGTFTRPGARLPCTRARPTATVQAPGRSTSIQPQLRWPSDLPPKERHMRATTSVAVSVNVRSCGPAM